METRAFGRTGLTVSAVGFGGAPIGFLEAEQAEVGKMLNALLDRGVTLIDTAAMYAGSEEAIGKAIASRRQEYVLVSKCSNPNADGPDCWSAAKVTASIERSLQRLRTDCLDVMLLHSCGRDVLERGEAWEALLRARDAGKVRCPGYSGDNDAARYAVGLPGLAALETSVNLCDQANLREVVPAAQARGIGVIAKRSIANSAWKPLAQQPGMYADYAKTYTERFQAMGLTLGDLGFSGEPAAVWPQVALRFTLSQPGVSAAIVGTTRLAHAEANLAAAAAGPLPAAALEAIRKAFSRAETAAGAAWPAQI
ncbi:MAG: aldo/keto reductase [Lentisphaerae bacterium]|nr:aldo/keto reductase [Lentisphaerota bacterium]